MKVKQIVTVQLSYFIGINMQYFVALIMLLVIVQPLAAQQPRLMIPVGHPQGVTSAVFNADGKLIASKSYNDKNTKIWDVRTGKLLYNLTGNILFLDDDSSVVLKLPGTHHALMNIFTGKIINTIPADSFPADLNWLYIPKTTMFVTYGAAEMRLWDNTAQLKQTARFKDSIAQVSSTANDSLLLVETAASAKDLYAYNFRSGKKRLLVSQKEFRVFTSPRYFAVVLKDGNGIIYSMNSLNKLRSFRIRKNDFGYIQSGSLSDKGDKLLLSYTDSALTMYSTVTGKILEDAVFERKVLNVAFVNNDAQYITYDEYTWADLFNATNGKHLYAFDSDTAALILRNVEPFIKLSPDRKHVMMVFADNTIRLWKLGSLPEQVQTFSGKTVGIGTAAVSTVTPHLAVGNQAGEIKVYNLANGKTDLVINTQTGRDIIDVLFSRDGKLLIASVDSVCIIWSFPEGKRLQTLPGNHWLTKTDISEDGNHLITSGGSLLTSGKIGLNDTIIKIWNWKQGRVVQHFLNKPEYTWVTGAFVDNNTSIVCNNPGDSTVFLLNNDGTKKWIYKSREWLFTSEVLNKHGLIGVRTSASVELISASTGELVKVFKFVNGTGTGFFQLSSDGTLLITGDSNGLLQLWDVASGKILKEVKAHQSGIRPQLINDTLVLTPSEDGTIQAWRFPSLEKVYSIIPMHNNESLVTEPSGYYFSTKNAAKDLHYVTSDLNIITFEQLDARYNRPDKVLEKINPADTLLISSYRKAYEKRIKKLGLHVETIGVSAAVPVTTITNSNKIPVAQQSGTLNLSIKAVDSVQQLRSFNIWVNEVPVFGINGINITHNHGHIFDTAITISLSQGINSIETSVINDQGVESFRRAVTVKYKPVKKIAEKLHFIGIGINLFKQPGHDLRWSVNDVRQLAKKLKEKYRSIIIDTLLDASVTKENILALKQKLKQLNVDDKVIVAYSGHGVLSKDLAYFLSTYHIDFNKPETNGLAYDELESLLDGIKPRKKLMLIDACHSGEVDKEEIERIESATKVLDSLGTKSDTTNRSSIVIKKKIGMTNSFELMQSLFADVSRGTGATIISAAGGMQYAQERGELQGGVFTYSIIDAFNNNTTLTVSQLKRIVSERVVMLTNGLQRPTSRSETNMFDWVIW